MTENNHPIVKDFKDCLFSFQKLLEMLNAKLNSKVGTSGALCVCVCPGKPYIMGMK